MYFVKFAKGMAWHAILFHDFSISVSLTLTTFHAPLIDILAKIWKFIYYFWTVTFNFLCHKNTTKIYIAINEWPINMENLASSLNERWSKRISNDFTPLISTYVILYWGFECYICTFKGKHLHVLRQKVSKTSTSVWVE